MKKKKICDNGHTFYKSSDCPVCPVCESRKPKGGLFESLGAPARRAIESAGIKTVQDLAGFSKKELLALHGLGPSSIPGLEKLLNDQGLELKP